MSLDNIKTIVLVMFENRSFDHMFGHLSYDGINDKVNGFTKPLSQYENIFKGDVYNPFKIITDAKMTSDLPHEYDEIADQLNVSKANGKARMNGFVKSYINKTGAAPNTKSPPMGFYKKELIPISSFLASTYTVCDNWFCPLPSSTQPNRTMAFCGDSTIFETKLQLIKATGNIFDWMTQRNIRWRVYHDGLSFFVLYNQLWKYVLGEHFRDYEFLFKDLQDEPDESFPQVIVVEPSYQDAPHIGPDHPNDNHPPLAIGWGEDFLRRTYDAVTANSKRWGETLMIVYYDEHGGFYDHVSPPNIPYDVKGSNTHHFDTLGVRIPAIIVSPYVTKGAVSQQLFDHTSVLQLLAEKFTPGKPYSNTVQQRKNMGINSISSVLNDVPDFAAPSAPGDAIFVKSFLGDSIPVAPDGGMAQSFEGAAISMMNQMPDETAKKYPELFQWRNAIEKERQP